MNMRTPSILALLIACFVFVDAGGGVSRAADPPKAMVIPKIPAGTIVGLKPEQPWTNIVLVSSSRVTQGDLQQLSETVANYASMLHFVILARVEQVATPANFQGNAPFQLGEVAVGLAIQEAGHFRIVTGPRKPGTPEPNFGFLESQVVRQAAKSLDDMRVVARQTTLMILDSPAIALQNGRHESLTIRTLVWVDPASGRLGSAVWFLRRTASDYQTVDNKAAYLPNNFREDRELHVDAGQFTFGVPGPKAFALVRLPAGVPIKMSPELSAVASLQVYRQADINNLAALLSIALQAL